MTDGPGIRKAAIDIGTVSTRLLIADVSGRTVTEVSRRTIVTHLGEGLSASGRLSEDALSRTVNVVQGYVRDAADAGCEEISAIATSAARDASNGEVLLDRLDVLGLRPKIITGGTEAYLSFLGATYALDEEDVLVADLGGGSTELILGSVLDGDGERRVEIDSARSIDVGSRRVTEMFLASDPPTHSKLAEAGRWSAEQFRPFFDALRCRPRCLVALAGTATSLSAMHLGLVEYDPAKVHGSHLTGADLASLKEDLARLPLAQRRAVPALDPGRAEVIVAGALIMETVLGLAGLDSVTVSEHDILYGILLAED